MTTPPSTRLLSIGEFAAATQLSPKALRLYDEQKLLLPARIDDASGYRYYRSDQVARGRLIRTLREMGLSLTDVATVVSLEAAAAQKRLSELAKEQDYRYAREKRAFRAALMQMRHAGSSDVPEVLERVRPGVTVAAREFSSDRDSFVERYRRELRTTEVMLADAGLEMTGAAFCRLTDPLCDEEGRLEVLVSVTPPEQLPHGLSFRHLPPARCAAISIEARRTHASDLAAALDTLFDWFDRRGYCATDAPLVSLEERTCGLRTQILWAFQTVATPER